MSGNKKSYGCLCFFSVLFFLGASLFWYVSLTALYGETPTPGSIGEAIGSALGSVIVGVLGMGIAIGLSLIFLILFIIWIVKKNKK
jgi:energy-converting hydrogenase Eha subunit E